MKNNNTKFIKKIRSVREDLGLSARDAGELVGVSYTYLLRIEQGVFDITEKLLLKMVKGYKLSTEAELDLFFLAGLVHPKIKKNILSDLKIYKKLYG